jgi:hypothetical protein
MVFETDVNSIENQLWLGREVWTLDVIMVQLISDKA